MEEKLKKIGNLCHMYRILNDIKKQDIVEKSGVKYPHAVNNFEQGISKSLPLFITYAEMILGVDICEEIEKNIYGKFSNFII